MRVKLNRIEIIFQNIYVGVLTLLLQKVNVLLHFIGKSPHKKATRTHVLSQIQLQLWLSER